MFPYQSNCAFAIERGATLGVEQIDTVLVWFCSKSAKWEVVCQVLVCLGQSKPSDTALDGSSSRVIQLEFFRQFLRREIFEVLSRAIKQNISERTCYLKELLQLRKLLEPAKF